MPDAHSETTACASCTELTRQIEKQSIGLHQALEDLGNAEAALRAERRKVTALKKEIAEMQAGSDHAEEGKAVFDYWNARLRKGRAREFKGDREKKVLERLKAGYTLVELIQAIDGAEHDCYVAPNGKRFDELEFIMRDAKNVDRFMAAEERRRAKVQDWLEEAAFGDVLPVAA